MEAAVEEWGGQKQTAYVFTDKARALHSSGWLNGGPHHHFGHRGGAEGEGGRSHLRCAAAFGYKAARVRVRARRAHSLETEIAMLVPGPAVLQLGPSEAVEADIGLVGDSDSGHHNVEAPGAVALAAMP